MFDAIISKADELLSGIGVIAEQTRSIKGLAASVVNTAVQNSDYNPFVVGLIIFTLACFVGYYVVWNVTPALHSPLMAVTNAISSVIIIGALISLSSVGKFNCSNLLGFIAVVLASVNIFGGFVVTKRMLSMFNKKK